MARRSATSVKQEASSIRIFKNPKVAFASGLIFIDALLVFLIVIYVPYTKIDWDAYMSQVTGFLEGERDYSNLKGDTGPLVYPAGFLYVYSAIQYITGGEVYAAQILFGLLYIINLAIVLFIYMKTDMLPLWALSLLCLSKRVHSIFVLRLFNDCFAMTFLHAAIAFLLYRRWHLGLIVFSVAVSIKMNVLLYAPPLFLLLLKALCISDVISTLAGAALVQILFGLPFLVSHPAAYISRAFNLGRVFIHFWYLLLGFMVQIATTVLLLWLRGSLMNYAPHGELVGYLAAHQPYMSVNFKFVPEPIFVSKEFAISMLTIHLVLLVTFTHYRWCKHEGGLLNFLYSRYVTMKMRFAGTSSSSSFSKILKNEHIVTTMFTGNFIGIVCARSLHYQFYSWYFYSLPYLLWRTSFPTLLRLILFIGVELCWNIYPSNIYSSFLLLCLHLVILYGLWSAPPEYPYADDKPETKKKE